MNQTTRSVLSPTYRIPLHRQLATIQNADQARLIRSLNLCRETDRYQTFNSDWPLDSAPSEREMAASGWFYLGNLDRTPCFSCGGVLRNWRRLDNPNTEHISHFPHCSMAQGRESRNIPDFNRQCPPTNCSRVNELTEQQRSDLRNMFPCEFPVTPSMRLIGDRVNSFNNWSFTFYGCWSSKGNLSRRAAKEGLFFLGDDDRVQCFSCGRVFSNWSGISDPVLEHRRQEPTCAMALGRESRNISSEHRESDLAALLRQHVPQFRALNEEKLLHESYRLSTFRSLPTSSRIDVRHFAAAGFYYTQRRNDVMCFFCSIVLIDQPADADPFSLRMHKRSCRFVRREDDCGNVGLGRSGSRQLLTCLDQNDTFSSAEEDRTEVLPTAPLQASTSLACIEIQVRHAKARTSER